MVWCELESESFLLLYFWDIDLLYVSLLEITTHEIASVKDVITNINYKTYLPIFILDDGGLYVGFLFSIFPVT